MVLKRILLTALSALGLGALAAGPVSAQQIPAPDSFNNSSACAATIPKPPKAPKDHPLKDSIDDGALTIADRNALSMEGNLCDVNGAKTGLGDPVAEGVDMARDLYEAVTVAKNTLDVRQKAYDSDASAGNKDALDKARTAYNTAVDNRDDYAGDGAVYSAVFTEEMRKAEAKTAAESWETAVSSMTNAQTKLDNVEYSDFVTQFAGFDANGEAREFVLYKVPDDATQTDGTAIDDDTVYVQLRGADGKIIAPAMGTGGTFVLPEALDGDGTDDDPVTYYNHTAGFTTDTSNFEGGQTATFVIRTIDLDGDTTTTDDVVNMVALNDGGASAVLNTDLRFGQDGADANADGIDDIYKAAKDAYDDAKDAAENNVNKDVQTRLDERERKAKARYDFYKAENDNAYQQLRDGKLSAPAGVDDPTVDGTQDGYEYTSAAYRSYSTAKTDRDTKANALVDAYDALAAANRAVENSLKDAGDYLGQLVELREYEKAVADKEAEDADAEEDTAAQKAAAKALTAARAQLKSYNDIQGLDDDDPVKKLVNSLLVADGDDDDDDGQALVDAISDTYDTAKSAKDTADGVATEVAGLTGEGGKVAMNTAAIEKNAGDITALDGRVTVNEGAIATNAGNIATNAENIATNAGNIATNTTMIGENRGMIETNTAGIATNKGMIETNTAGIGANTGAIADNANMIGSNSAAINRNSTQIGELNESLETVRAGVAASMALAGMPAINGRGISIGVGSFDGESAFAVGFQIQGEMASFKVGVTSGGGATGASAGVGFQF